MPAIGLGTLGSDHADLNSVAEAVRGAFEAGYRHFDCAAVYGNEDAIGRVFREILDSGVQRDGRLPTFNSTRSTFTWFTGRSPTGIPQAAPSSRVPRKRDPTSTKSS